MLRNAFISLDGMYRSMLTRMFDPKCALKCCAAGLLPMSGFIGWILNNPSTADGFEDDPTIRRLWAFTRFWGFNEMRVANTNMYRCTNPKDALVPPEEILTINDQWLTDIHSKSAITLCAWGDKANSLLVDRTVRLLHPLGALHSLRVTKQGNPQHPLYLPGELVPQLWKPYKWIN